MKKQLSFGMVTLLLVTLLAGCGGKSNEQSSNQNNVNSSTSSVKSSKSDKSSSSKGPVKTVSDIQISLGPKDGKAYITVTGVQSNYTAEEFKWAWGLKEQNSSLFADGKATPDASDFKAVSFNSNNYFSVEYCLTDIENIKAGTLYRIYGGTPETYGDIQFASNQFGANDGTRKYYLRMDVDNSLVFENIQPFTYTQASIVEIARADLPAGITQPGAYLKFGGANSKNITTTTLDEWYADNKIAGNFQRVIPADSYLLHDHVSEERFWKIEGKNVFFYLYVGFIEEGEGWMTHFDLVSGNVESGLQTQTTFNGETEYTVGEATFKIYSDTSKSGEENYWGCLGVYRMTSTELQ